ncbi:MAG: NAD(P)-dependent oxidoreductase [Nitrospina sp.]|jgi:UDP-glucose 4-epimerase|nr:NAD(P)-dependent oxidoreductase [Nitrospina sp.]
MKYERVAVTGAAGLIGSAVIRHLSKANIEVIAFDAPGTPDRVPGSCVSIEQVDLLDPRMVEILETTQPQAVVHAAAHPGGKSLQEPTENVRVNALGSMQIFDWCARTGSHVIFLSSSVVYGNSTEDPISETSDLRPGTVYGIAKVACEQWLRVLERGYGLSWTTLRLFATYGPGHQPSLEQGIVNILLTQLLKGNRVVVKGSLKRRRDVVYVEDVAAIIAQALCCPEAQGQIINVGSGNAATIGEMISLLCDTLKRPYSTVEIIEEAGTVGDPFSNVADITQMRKLLNFEPQFELKAGLEAFIKGRKDSMNKTI